MNTDLEPIKVPASERWKHWRMRQMPAVVFACAVSLLGWLWLRWVEPATIVAEVEVPTADVRAHVAGYLSGRTLQLWQEVREGEELGHLITTDPQVVNASLAVIRAEAEWLGKSLQSVSDQLRVTLEYERLQLEWMKHRIEAASLKMQLRQAEHEVHRLEPLHRKGMTSEYDFDVAKNLRDDLAAQLEEQRSLAERIEPALQVLDPASGKEKVLNPQEALRASIRLNEEKLRLTEAQLNPVSLRAPIGGVIVAIYRRPGEAVTSGDTIARISAKEGATLVGYLRQPLAFEPQPGMIAEVRSRGWRRVVGEGRVDQVAPRMEAIPTTMMATMRLTTTQVENGLRLHIRPPAGMPLRPGEIVDVVLRP